MHALSNAPSLVPQARAVAEKFRVAFELFGKCHCTYNSATLLSDNDIDELSKSTNYLPVYVLRCHYFTYTGIVIDNFMAYYRSTFPEATVTPKMHIMEDHITQFLQMWRVGFGFHGEQGAESLHALIRRISRSYGSIQNRVDRLKSVIKEHHLQVSPLLAAQEPVPKRRRTL